jgi:hypothetical protein
MQSVPITTDVVSSNLDQSEVSSIWVRTKSHLSWWCYRKRSRAHAQPEVTSPEAALTGSHGGDRVRIRGFSPRFPLLTIGVAQNVGTRDQRGSIGCVHAQPGFPRFFGCFRICCVVLHVLVLTVWYFYFTKSQMVHLITQ